MVYVYMKAGFSLKLDREMENHSEEHSEGTKFPLMWLENEPQRMQIFL
jgi:hypothetical protein